MNTQELITLMQAGDMSKCQTVFEAHCIVKNLDEAFKQFDPQQHTVMIDKSKRPDKLIKGDDGNIEKVVYVARLPLAIQKKIVRLAAAFLGTPAVESTPAGPAEENMDEAIRKTWNDNKLDYSFKNLAKKTMSQRESAELWYLREVDASYWEGTNTSGKYKLSMKVLSKCQGDKLYPVFDDYGDMIAFGRGYKLRDNEGKEVNHLDVYTADTVYYARNINGAWEFANEAKDYSVGVKALPNLIKKIPVVYYHQPLTEWDDVQPLIDRLETLISNLADTNDYTGSPIILAEGDVTGFSEKGEQGKMLQLDNGAKVSYLDLPTAPESIRMEIEGLLKYIHSLTSTPDISFEQMKGLGVFSGIALKMLFLDAHLKAADKEEIFGEGLQRRLNFMKAALATIDSRLKAAVKMTIKPKFTYYLPENIGEDLANIKAALDAGVISKETAIKMNPMLSDPEAEIEAIKAEKEAAPAPVQPVPPLPTPKPILN